MDKKHIAPIIIILLGVLFVLAGILWQANRTTVRSAQVPTPQATVAVVERVDVQTAKDALDQGSAILLDVRSTASFAEAHISGAINIPLTDLKTRVGELDSNRWIITYCT